MTTVNRDSPGEKIMGLMSASEGMIEEMEHNESLARSKIKITPLTMRWVRDLSTFLVVIINLLLLAFREFEENNLKTEETNSIVAQCITYILVVQLGLAICVLLFYIFSKGKLVVHSKWREHAKMVRKRNKQNGLEIEIDPHISVQEMSINETRYILHTRGPSAREFVKEGKRSFGNFYTALEYYLLSTVFLLREKYFLYYVFYISISVVAYFIDEIFLCILLLDFTIRIPTLNNVIRAVTENI